MQQPNKKKLKPLVVSSKDHPRYQAYQDSLTAYNAGENTYKMMKNTKGYKNVKSLSSTPEFIKANNAGDAIDRLEKLNGEFRPKEIYSKTYIHHDGVEYGQDGIELERFHKPKQEVIIGTPSPNVKKELPKIKPQLRNKSKVNMLTPKGLVPLSNNTIETSINIRPNAIIPNFSISEDNTRMSGKGYGSGRNDENASVDKAIRAKESADTYNASIEKKYNNEEAKKNPKAQERYKTLKNNVTITPKYAMGGYLTKRLPKNNRHIAPSVITAGIGAAAPLIGALGQQNVAIEARQALISSALKQKSLDDVDILNDYDTSGVGEVNYYARGGNLTTSPIRGKFSTIGGKLKSLSNNAELVEGNTHGEKTIDNSYGVTLVDQNKPVAEVEDEEVLVDDSKVFSDRLMYDKNNSFADKMKSIATKTGKIEKKLDKSSDTRSRNTYERQLAGMKMAEEALFNKQEEVKQFEGEKELDIMANGGTINDNDLTKKLAKQYKDANSINDPSFFSDLAPSLLDNAINLGITASTPRLPRPLRAIPRQMNTTYDVSPQLAEVTDNINAIEDNILGNTANSNTARANIASARLRGTQQKLGILNTKENVETSLENANTMNMQQFDEINRNSDNAFNETQFTRANDIQSRISGNVAEFQDNINQTQANRNLRDYYDQVLMLDLLDDKTEAKKRLYSKIPGMRNKKYIAPLIK